MIRAVLDTNVLVSALIRSKGKPSRILPQAGTRFDWLTCAFILSEVADVLTRKHIQAKYRRQTTERNRVRYLEKIRASAEVVEVKTQVWAVPNDLKDNFILACAKDGQANFVVTGDRHLLSLDTFEGIKIVTPEQFLRMLESESET